MRLYSKKQIEQMKNMPHTKESITQIVLFLLVICVILATIAWVILGAKNIV